MVQLNDLVHLHSDAEHRVQAGHRFLKNHRHLVAAQMLHHIQRRLGNVINAVARVKADGALHNLPLRALNQLHQRKTGDGFAAAGFPDHADGLALWYFKADAVDRLYGSDIGEEIGVQIIEFHDIVWILHLRHIFLRRNVFALALFFNGRRNFAVFL